MKAELWCRLSCSGRESQAKGGALMKVELWSRSTGGDEALVEMELWSRSSGDDKALVAGFARQWGVSMILEVWPQVLARKSRSRKGGSRFPAAVVKR